MRTIPRFRQTLFAAGLSAIIAISGFHPASADQTEEDRRGPGFGRQEVTFDLATGKVDRALPFDESFDLVVKDPATGVEAVSVSLFEAEEPFWVTPCDVGTRPRCGQADQWICVKDPEIRSAFGPREKFLRSKDRNNEVVECRYLPDVTWIAPLLKSNGDGANIFHLTIPPLRAQRYYQFLVFLRMQATVVASLQSAFVDRVTNTVYTRLGSLDPRTAQAGDFDEVYLELRRDLTRSAQSFGLVLVIDPNHPLLAGFPGEIAAAVQKELKTAVAVRTGPITSAIGRIDPGDCVQALRAYKDARNRLDLKPEEEAEIPIPPAEPSDLCDETDPIVLEDIAGVYEQAEDTLKRRATALREPSDTPAEAEAEANQSEKATGLAFGVANQLRQLARNRREALDLSREIAQQVAQKAILQRVLFARASTNGTFESRQKWQITGDFGLLSAWELDEVAPYLGTNFYFRPVNKQAPLEGGFFRQPMRRLSVTVGVVITDLGDDRTRDALLDGDLSLLAGVGWRLSDAVRLGAGGVFIRERDPNPLIDDPSVAVSPYVSLSIDWDVRGLVNWLNKLWKTN